jgi:selenium metabolism protein YedF
MKTVDARGQACPQPVILARKALAEAQEVTVIVDNDTAQMNVSRMAEKAGCLVESEQRPDGVYLRIQAAHTALVGTAVPAGNKVVLVTDDTLGRGSAELGAILMRGFFHTLNEAPLLPTTIIFMNAGVRLVTEGSPVLEDLRVLGDKGVEVWACGTCLDYYGLKAKLATGQVSNMYSIAEALLQANSVISI